MSITLILLILLCILLCFIYFFRVKEINKKHNLSNQLPKNEIIFQRMQTEPTMETLRKIERQKVEEDPPEIKRLNELINDFQKTYSWDCLIAVGDIYKNGAYPRFLPNEYIALNCYKIAAMCPDGTVAGIAQVKYIEMRSDPISAEDKKGKPLPTKYGEYICELAMEKVTSTPYSQFEKPKHIKPEARIPISVQDPITNYDNLFMDLDIGYDFEPITLHEHVDRLVPVQVAAYRTDSQNVHDHSVTSIAKKNLESIGSTDVKQEQQDVKIAKFKEIIRAHPELSSKEASDAVKVLESLGSSTHSTFDKSEKQILTSVLDKIEKTENQDNLIETLGKQLASAVENGHVVCSTGKITRMLGTFDGSDIDGIEKTRPIWAIKEELANLASKIREDNIKNLTESQKQQYDLGHLPELDQKLKEDFKDKAEQIYYKDLNMNSKIIDPLIQMYEEAF